MIISFQDFQNESIAALTLGNTPGMGPVVSPQPSPIPGQTQGAPMGSGDIGSNWKQAHINNKYPNMIHADDLKRFAKQHSAKSKKAKKSSEKGLPKLSTLIVDFETYVSKD